MILILGSMPGAASLAAGQYYAHPRNAFWPIIGRLLGFPPDLPYPERLAVLRSRGIALWDVLHSCSRAGSLDASIDESSIRPNAIGRFLETHGAIQRIYFNGAKAEQAFRRHVLPSLDHRGGAMSGCRLPSTSPAHAARSLEQKLAAWRAIVRDLPGAFKQGLEP